MSVDFGVRQLSVTDDVKKQISVYRILRDRAYAKLVPVDRQAFNHERKRNWAFNGRRPSDWVSLEMRPSCQTLPAPDIWEIVPGAYALEHHAYYELCSSTEETQQGNMNYLRCEGRKLAVVNSTLVIDCLRSDTQHFKPREADRNGTYVFDGSQLAVSLFKTPETIETELFTLDGFDALNDFKTLVEEYGLTGLKFKKLWQGDSFMEA